MIFLAYNFIVVLAIIASILVLFIFKKCNRQEKIFMLYICANGFFELLAWSLIEYFDVENNLPGLHLYTAIQFFLLTVFFNSCLNSLGKKLPIRVILFIGGGLLLVNSIFIQSIYTYNSYSKSIVDLFVIMFCLILFGLFLTDKNHNPRYMKASVSFVSAVFLHSSVSIIIYIYSNEIMKMAPALRDNIWNLRLLINYIAILMIYAGLFQIYLKKGDEEIKKELLTEMYK